MLLSGIALPGARPRIDLEFNIASAGPPRHAETLQQCGQPAASWRKRRCDLSRRGRWANFAQRRDATQIMILTCPSCRTRYQADSAHFVTPGRNVRCAKCGHVWFQAAPTPDA